ncbi:MAG: transposase [Verrucomicrobiota bacterium]
MYLRISCQEHHEFNLSGRCIMSCARGDKREPIYQDDEDCEMFLSTLGEACERTGWRIHAYVLMGNHYHILLETPEANLVAGMKWFQGTYTMRYNGRHKQSGHLFQGRYKAVLIDSKAPEYFATVADYIHLNPARSRVIRRGLTTLTDYIWSSYPVYLNLRRRPDWLVVDRALSCLHLADDSGGRRKYKRYMEGRRIELMEDQEAEENTERWKKIRRGWVFGSEEFKEQMLSRLSEAIEQGKPSSFSGPAKRDHDEVEATRLLRASLKRLGLKPSSLAELPKTAPEKKVIAWLLKKRTVVRNEWIAHHLCAGHPANIPGYVKFVKQSTDKYIVDLKMMLKSED